MQTKISRLFNGKDSRLCIDQYGKPIWAKTLQELKDKAGSSKAEKVYIDNVVHNKTYHCGYIVARRWFSIGIDILPAAAVSHIGNSARFSRKVVDAAALADIMMVERN